MELLYGNFTIAVTMLLTKGMAVFRAQKYNGLGAFHESDLQEFYELTPAADFIGTDALSEFIKCM